MNGNWFTVTNSRVQKQENHNAYLLPTFRRRSNIYAPRCILSYLWINFSAQIWSEFVHSDLMGIIRRKWISLSVFKANLFLKHSAFFVKWKKPTSILLLREDARMHDRRANSHSSISPRAHWIWIWMANSPWNFTVIAFGRFMFVLCWWWLGSFLFYRFYEFATTGKCGEAINWFR